MTSINIKKPDTVTPCPTEGPQGLSPVGYWDMSTQRVSQVDLVTESPLAISYNGIAHAVMMVTPQDIEDFLFGFSLSEGIIQSREEIRDWQLDSAPLCDGRQALTADIQLSPRQLMQFKQSRQVRRGATGCGICGTESLSAALPALAPLPVSTLPDPQRLMHWREHFGDWQTLGNQVGALHGALLLSPTAEGLFCREDIGRHNALDKLIGHSLRTGRSLHQHAVLMSSRCSTELIQKAVRAGLSTLIHLASPSDLAVQLARHYGLNLIHLPRHSGPRLYAAANLQHPEIL